MGYRVGQYQAAYSDDQADQKGSPPKHYIDAAFCGLHYDIGILIPFTVYCIEVITSCLRLLHGNQCLPESDVTPALIRLDHCLAVWLPIKVLQLAAGFFDQTFKAWLRIVHPGAGFTYEILIC